MVGPAAERVGAHAVAALAARRHVDGVLAHHEISLRILEITPQPVQVDRMRHHGVVHQRDAHALAVVELQRFGTGERNAVERPGELLHVAGQMQFDVARRRAAVRILEQAFQVPVSQHASAVAAQANARIVQPVRRRHGLHVDQRIAALAFRMGLHSGAAVIHAGHRRHVVAAVIHRGVIDRRRRRMRAVIHAAMPHVGHAQQRPRIQRRHRRTQAFAHGQGAADVTGAAHVLGEHGEGVLAGRLDNDIEGLGDRDAELVDRYRVHVLAIDRDHGHLHAGNAHVEIGHRRTVDETQADTLAGLEQARPVAERRGAVHQVGVGVGVDVRQISRRHPHPAPALAVLERGSQAVAVGITQEIAERALGVVVVTRHLLQARVQVVRRQVGPVAEQHHMVALVPERLGLARVHDQRAVQAGLLLEAGVAVVPVGAGLVELETVQPGFTAADAVEAHARHAIHVGRQQDAMPMDGRGVAEQGARRKGVVDAQRHGVAFAPTQNRRRQGTVDGDGGTAFAGEVDR